MSEDSLKRLREHHKRLADMAQSAVGSDLVRAMQIQGDALRAIQRTSALSALSSQRRGFVQVLEQVKPTQALYESARIPRLIHESAFPVRLVLPEAFDSSRWLSGSVTQLFGKEWQKQVASVNFTQSVVAAQLKAFGGALTGADFAGRFAEQLREPMRQLQELFDGYEEDERRLLTAIVPLGWLISPSMGMGMIRGLAAELDARSTEEIDAALISCFNPERCAKIVAGLYDDPTFEELQPLIDEALAVHTEGHYRAAILAWLAAIDGVAARKFGVRKVYGELKKKNGGQFRIAIEQSGHGREAFTEALIDILKRVSMTKDVDPHVPKRDVVMHGREIDFGNERASIQLLLVLEVLHFCEPAVRDEDLLIDAV